MAKTPAMKMLRVLPICAAAILLGVEAYVHGLWTGRWSQGLELKPAVARLDQVPLKFGDWQKVSDETLTALEVEQARYAGYLHRHYENRKSGQVVKVLLACGPAGPLAVHAPDACYWGAGYRLNGSLDQHVESYAGGNSSAELRKARFEKQGPTGLVGLRIYWSWNADGEWKAPSNPRLVFAGSSALYKLYVSHDAAEDSSRADEACQQFLRAFLPEVDKALFRESELTH
jgi:hypothetical protein